MKKIILSIAALTVLAFTSCVSDDENFNDDIKSSYDVSAEALLANAQKELVDQMATPSVNLNLFRFFSQYWTATIYTAEPRYNLTARTVPDNQWENLYRDVLGNLKSAEEVINKEVKPEGMADADWQKKQKNKIAILEVLRVYTFQVLVDSFGDIPYTEALRNPEIILPKYDDDTTIYPKLIDRINLAIAQLDDTGTSFDTGDLIYKGDIAGWKLFANSIKLKLGTNISDINPTLAKTTIESAYTAGVIVDNSKNAVLNYAAFAPNYNPIFDELVASERNDFIPANTLVDVMNTLSDPRRPIYFTPMSDGSYVGGIYGAYNGDPYGSSYSHIGDLIKKSDAAGVLAEATEINFYLAEAAARGYSVGNSEDIYYNNAITASLSYWGVSAADISSYLASPDVNYATAPGASWKEKIGTQEWLALFNRGFESWNAYRRLDSPVLIAPTRAVPAADHKVPVRETYPVNEQTVNNTNWKAASDAIGGDKLTTKVFWDVN